MKFRFLILTLLLLVAAVAATAQDVDDVIRTETSLVMGEVISHRVAPLMELARRQS